MYIFACHESAIHAKCSRAHQIPGKETGRYAATLTVQSAGSWTITIKSGFGNSELTLLPIVAVAANESDASQPDTTEPVQRPN